MNSSGWTPKGLTNEYLKSHGVDHINPIGVETIDIPDSARSSQPAEIRSVRIFTSVSALWEGGTRLRRTHSLSQTWWITE
ncbi:MAG: hypothetical protein WCA20_11720 [Candidatus Sulfotelmatobacter sp.]